MKYLILGLLIIGIVSKTNAVEHTPSRIPFYILNAANAYKVDVNLMYAICLTESKCNARAVNKDDGTPEEKAAGIKVKSYGLFQIKAETARTLGFVDKETITITKKRGKHTVKIQKVIDHSNDLFKADVNAIYAAKLIHKLYQKYGTTERVISAYNAGHPIKSNGDYVLKVLKNYVKLTIDKR
jgi:soluble lytic murein transglycosylase-like protein